MEHQIFFEAVAQIIPTLLIAILLGSKFSNEKKERKDFLGDMLSSVPPFVIFVIVLMGEVATLMVLWNGTYKEIQVQIIILSLVFAGLIILNQIFSFISKDRKALGYLGILVIAFFIIWKYFS